MTIDVQALVQLFGFSLESEELRQNLTAMGFKAKVSMPSLRKLGSQNVSDNKRGIDLMFIERAEFEECYGKPKSLGEAIFTGLGLDPIGFKLLAPYTGIPGKAIAEAKNRTQIHQVLGAGLVRDQDAGVVYSESWRISSVNLFAQYSEDGELKSLQFNLPMLETLSKKPA
jgi:hypothetical protein